MSIRIPNNAQFMQHHGHALWVLYSTVFLQFLCHHWQNCICALTTPHAFLTRVRRVDVRKKAFFSPHTSQVQYAYWHSLFFCPLYKSPCGVRRQTTPNDQYPRGCINRYFRRFLDGWRY